MPTSLQLTPELARYGEQQVKIGIFSDSHDDIPSLTAAAQAAVAAGAEALLHCGDVVAAVTLARLPEWPVPMHIIHGNNTGDIYALARIAERSTWATARSSWFTTRATHGPWPPPATGMWSAAVTTTRLRWSR